MEKLLSGTCQYVVVKDQSKKTGNDYIAVKLKFNDYELSTPTFLTSDQFYIISNAVKKVGN